MRRCCRLCCITLCICVCFGDEAGCKHCQYHSCPGCWLRLVSLSTAECCTYACLLQALCWAHWQLDIWPPEANYALCCSRMSHCVQLSSIM